MISHEFLATETATLSLLDGSQRSPLFPQPAAAVPEEPPLALPGLLAGEDMLLWAGEIANQPPLPLEAVGMWEGFLPFLADGDRNRGDSLISDAALTELWADAHHALNDFWRSPDRDASLALAFGDGEAAVPTQSVVQQLIDGRILPSIAVLREAELGSQGAYAAEADTIFLAKELFGQPEKLLRIFMEELGHFIDDHRGPVDAEGDEGALFAAEVFEDELGPEAIAVLKAEDDAATLQWGSETLQVERADLGPGTFTVGQSGQLAVEFLADGGSYEGQLAVFSLEGMEGIDPASTAFIQEAARRALTNSPEGYVIISDIDEGATLVGQLGERDRNSGTAAGVKGITFAPGTRVAVMLVPDGTVQEVFENPSVGGNLRPLFSVASANPAGKIHMGEIRPGVYAMEDVRLDTDSDADFNDVIFRLQGVTGQIESINTIIGNQQIWVNTPLGQQLFLISDNPLAIPGFVASDNPLFPPVDAANLQVSIPTGVAKFDASATEAEIAATGAARITFGTQTVYIGTNQVTSINQNPIVASFDSANPANNWIRTDYEVTGTDGRGLGIAWDGTSLYGVFTVDGTQGTPAEDFRRAANDAQQQWLRSYGAGGGAAVSVLGRIDPRTGELLDAAYLSAVLNNGNSNTLRVTDLAVNAGGNLVVSAQSFFSPRRPDGTALTPPNPVGSSPFAYTIEITPDLKQVVSTASPGWT